MNNTIKKYYSDDILRQACAGFDIKFDAAKLIKGNSNLIYDCGNKILRISHSVIRAKSDIEPELNWLLFLKKNELPVVDIIPSKSGNILVQIGEAENHFTIVCFEKIIGNKITKEYWNDEHFKKLGKMTGLLHRVGGQYEQGDNSAYKNWDGIIEFDGHQYLPDDKRELIRLHHELVRQINQFPKTKNNYGLVHYDIHHGNYLLKKSSAQLILFDFEMTCKSWFINDAAIVLYYAHHFSQSIKDEQFEAYFTAAFWKGYEQENKIAGFEKKWMPYFLLYRDLMVLGFLMKIWDMENLPENGVKYLRMVESSIDYRREKLGV